MPELNFGRGFKALLIMLVATFLLACTNQPEPEAQLTQSPNDDHQYRVITLPNQLRVLLISDPDTRKAAAALDVMVGSGDNPPGRGGLAHFLEHMLFLGTDKYPDASEYEQYITEHGGNRNAYTSFENTNYFFDINADYLPEALDRFAQFFISPSFDAQYVDREKNAVQAEYQLGIKSDGRRGLDVLQQNMNPDHPFSQFSVGSLESLADRPDSMIRDDLLTFYRKHYSANVMRLVVLGSESLDELEQMVAPMFAAIPNRNYQPVQFEQPIFANGSLPMLVQIKPQATLRSLQVNFPVDDYRGQYRAKPLAYVGNLVGHEGAGSLLSQLKQEGLVEGLGAGSGLAWRGGALFSVSFTLTELGVQKQDRVLGLLFAYTDMLREQGPQQWLYDEQARLAQLSFRFREDAEPIGYVSGLASGMQHYDVEDTLQGPYVMDAFDPDMIGELLAQLRPENAQIILNDQSVSTDRVSPYYEVPYSQETESAETIAIWESIAGPLSLNLPPPNQFIAEDLALIEPEPATTGAPAIIERGERDTIWFGQDDEFKVPRGASYVNFRSPLVGADASQTAMAVLYTSLINDKVNEFSYPAALAGLNFRIYKHAQGISLRVGGYNDKQQVLLDRLIEVIKEPEFDPMRFENIRRNMIRGLENSITKRPMSQVADDLREALLYGEWGEAPLIDALESASLADVEAYSTAFWDSASAEIMIYGNYPKTAVDGIAVSVRSLLGSSPVPELPDLKVLKLGSGEIAQYRVAVPHDDSVVAWYLQGAGDSWRDRAASALTAQIMKSGFFQQLRTEQQLGYAVSASSFPQLDVPGIVMLVQSPSHSADAVANSMQAFMLSVEGNLDADQFARHQVALRSQILRPHKNMLERAEFYWQSIARKQYEFAGRQQLADAISDFTLADWQEYYNRVFIQQRHSLQVVTPGKWGTFPENSGQQYDSAGDIKRDHPAYSID
ncbi:MAG: insulinase family protein [Halioglobus sp.]